MCSRDRKENCKNLKLFKIEQQSYFPHCYSDKGLKGTVVIRTHKYMGLDITSRVLLRELWKLLNYVNPSSASGQKTIQRFIWSMRSSLTRRMQFSYFLLHHKFPTRIIILDAFSSTIGKTCCLLIWPINLYRYWNRWFNKSYLGFKVISLYFWV